MIGYRAISQCNMFEWCSMFITKYVRENIVYIFIAVLTIFKKSAKKNSDEIRN